MSQRIIDLDEAAPNEVVVKIDGTSYDFPSDVPVPDYLAISRCMAELDTAAGEEAIAALEDLYERVLRLFVDAGNELPVDEEGDKYLPIGPRKLGRLILDIYGAGELAAPADPPTTPRKRRTGATKTKPRTKARSRS